MNKIILASIILCIGCGSSVVRPTTLTSISGNPVRMEGNKISIINDNIDREILLKAIKYINTEIGFVLLTTDPVYDSKIFISEDIISYQHGDFESMLNGPIRETSNENLSYEDDQAIILGRASFDVPIDGVIKECNVTINYFIPDRRWRAGSIKHELLHCLGLRDSDQWGSIMNEHFVGYRSSRINDRGLSYIRRTYNGR